MCGINGLVALSRPKEKSRELVESMSNTLVHRGPDGHGLWQSGGGEVTLGHTRLAIIDLSPSGHQPMTSKSGRYTVTFNGEIYNHPELRARLGAVNLRGTSDTEVILESINEFGILKTISGAVGMFAIGLWDDKLKTLHLLRDRVGEKPIYFGYVGQDFVFASELKAIQCHPDFKNSIDQTALALYMKYGYVPGPYSIFEGIQKLEPGHHLQISLDDLRRRKNPGISPYWQLKDHIPNQPREFASDQEAIDELEHLLLRSVKQQMGADVPVGCFLSGGVDSSTVTALMQSLSTKPIRTFSIGFEDKTYNEAPFAEEVARHLGTDHTTLYASSSDAIEVISKLPEIYDEPFSDSSQIPTFLVAQLARQNVTVSLSGDGGDELFGGYNRYLMTHMTWSKLNRVPQGLRRALAWTLNSSPRLTVGLYDAVAPLLPGPLKVNNPASKIQKAAAVLPLKNVEEVYERLISQWPEPKTVVLNGNPLNSQLVTERSHFSQLDNSINKLMYLDCLNYLPDDILCKVDRASMAVSLESRIPLLDHRVMEWAWSLPLNLKIRNSTNKWILRQVLYKYVPKALIERPKMGFAMPIGDWLRGPLKEWASDLLNEDLLKRHGFLNHATINKVWQEHLADKKNWEHPLWTVLMFQSWLNRQY